AREFTVVSVDLPGHAFTGTADTALMTLPGMAHAVQALLQTLAMKPAVLVGHSAGAAVAAEMVLQTQPSDRPLLVALNPAWLPIHGWAGWLFAPAAKLVTLNPLSGWLMAKQAARGDLVQRLLQGTGSRLSAEGVRLYKRLFGQPVHVRGVLTMMERWDLPAWSPHLAQLDSPVLLLCAVSRCCPHACAKVRASCCASWRPPTPAKLTLARPSLSMTKTGVTPARTCCCATSNAKRKALAKGVPPPAGSPDNARLARTSDRVGGSNTCACPALKDNTHT
ncbi:MAG: alpha/beta fold hydrolase, partial [Betaproteobacteria bacterium]|nr:alpha/beta fold hydrolase [Betaproteobacteria bacterium]